MRRISTSEKPQNIILTAAQNRRQIAEYLENVSENDDKSVLYLRRGNYEMAAECAILAQEYMRLASNIKIEDIKLHAMYN